MKKFLQIMEDENSWARICLVTFLAFLIETVFFYFLYNELLVPFGLPEIGFWRMFGIVVFFSVVIKFIKSELSR